MLVYLVFLKTDFGIKLLSLHNTLEGAFNFRDELVDCRNVQINAIKIKD